ncbi:hypothetical protein AB97_5074 [Escherichia coli 1-110-08_S3_C1]|nr:hypothetical protein ECDEC14D_4898 [Escherichia coli DEC14D]ENB98733.1 hypothetical protein ECP02994384_4829 [Escherichia coli P0299438.4]ESE37439.1 hypothetical protein HMPREF1622_01028 [Escherichia coli A35218R]EYE09757.1 hypothetical protein AC55_5158 [Escherichia coli 1-110-08_S3_C3]EYE16210.1 hypothetical protein AC25_5004 [Escherichia coli 1-110-08_S3_C2]EYE18255.1 hypothetical protein AB97_5074 [Escherichia coli 1-110-08_S3_C1]KEO05329.1 hypothetical protein AC44_5041 [Escherichia c
MNPDFFVSLLSIIMSLYSSKCLSDWHYLLSQLFYNVPQFLKS